MDKEHNIKINNITPEGKHSLLSRTIMALLLVAIVLPCILIGDYVFMVLIFVAAMISTYEIVKAPQSIEKKFSNLIFFFAYFAMIILIYWTFSARIINTYLEFSSSSDSPFVYNLYAGFNSPSVSLSALAVSILFLFLMVLFDKNFTIHDAFYFIGMLFVVSLGYQSIMFLRYYPFYSYDAALTNAVISNDEALKIILQDKLSDPWFKYGESACLILYMGLGTIMADTGAYLTGVLFGKHPLCPRISPKKTVEGFVGGIVLSVLVTCGFSFALIFTGHPLVYGLLDADHWYFILIISILMPFLSTFGDLLFSSIKRGYKIKDFGKILRSHGGMLDRLDSVLITSILLGLIIPLFKTILDFASKL